MFGVASLRQSRSVISPTVSLGNDTNSGNVSVINFFAMLLRFSMNPNGFIVNNAHEITSRKPAIF